MGKPSFHDLFDFPMSYSFWRALCQQHDEPVPPNADIPPYNLTDEESDQAFIKWQDEQRELLFSSKPLPARPEPIPMHAPPTAPKRLKGIAI